MKRFLDKEITCGELRKFFLKPYCQKTNNNALVRKWAVDSHINIEVRNCAIKFTNSNTHIIISNNTNEISAET